MATSKDLQLFMELFTGRKGILKERNENKLIYENLTEQHLQEQLARKDSFGMFLRTEDDEVRVAMFDLDVKQSKRPLAELLPKMAVEKAKGEKILNAINELGLSREHFLVEFPGVGYHLWFFFDEFIPSALAAQFLSVIERKAGISPTVYKPNLQNIPAGSYGEAIWFPLRYNDNSKLHSVYIDELSRFDPANYDPTYNFAPLYKVKRISTALVKKISYMN